MTGHNFSVPRLAFLVYRSRSGSTFFGDRLSRHPDVLATPESQVAPRLIKYFQQRRARKNNVNHQLLTDYLLDERRLRDWNFPRENLFQELKERNAQDWATTFHIICKVYRDWKKPGSKTVVFKKSGWYYKNIDLLLSTYPNSIIIGMIRDPRAVYNSARKALHVETLRPMADNILSNALGWRDYINSLRGAAHKWPGRIFFVRYESLLHDVPGILSEAWNNLGVRVLSESEMIGALALRGESHLVTPAEKYLHENVSKKPIIERIGKWREELPKWQSGLIGCICRKEMREFGYL